MNHPLQWVLLELQEEYDRAKEKHGENTLDGASATDLTRLAALGEEFGEVANTLTYDQFDVERLREELIQLANVAVTWASIL